jgi:hypothetical protein
MRAVLAVLALAMSLPAWGGDAAGAWRTYLAESAEREPAMRFPYDGCFAASAGRHALPKALLIALARGESNFDPRAVSSAGAHGVMQILWPATARELGFRRVSELYEPCRNIDAGARYLKGLLERYDGDLHLALAAYNYGPGRISAGGRPVPPGAAWYSGYIHRHLEYVLDARGDWSDRAERTVAVFAAPWRAEALVQALSERAPEVRLDWFREDTARFRVVLVAASGEELESARQQLTRLGWRF